VYTILDLRWSSRSCWSCERDRATDANLDMQNTNPNPRFTTNVGYNLDADWGAPIKEKLKKAAVYVPAKSKVRGMGCVFVYFFGLFGWVGADG